MNCDESLNGCVLSKTRENSDISAQPAKKLISIIDCEEPRTKLKDKIRRTHEKI